MLKYIISLLEWHFNFVRWILSVENTRCYFNCKEPHLTITSVLSFIKEDILFAESSDPWAQDDRDYTYDELLQRVFGIMRDKNPEMVAGEKKKFVMRPPQVVRVGTKKTAFVNFTEIAKM